MWLLLSRGNIQSTSTLNDWAGYIDKINKQDLTRVNYYDY